MATRKTSAGLWPSRNWQSNAGNPIANTGSSSTFGGNNTQPVEAVNCIPYLANPSSRSTNNVTSPNPLGTIRASSPFHSSFGPTPTAATVTPAAASGTTAAATPAVTAFTASTTVPTTTATVVNSPFAFAAPPSSIATPAGIAPAMTATTTASGFSAGNSSASPVPLFGLVFESVASSTTPTYNLANSQHTASSTATTASPIASLSATMVQSDIVKMIRFEFEWRLIDVLFKSGDGFTRSYKCKSGQNEYEFQCAVKKIENCFLFQIICATEKDYSQLMWVTRASITNKSKTLNENMTTTDWVDSRKISISHPLLQDLFTLGPNGFYSIIVTLSSDSDLESHPISTSAMHCFSILNRMLQDVDSHDVSFEFEVPCQSYVQEPISDKTPEHDPANTSSNSSYDAFPELARELKIEDIDDGVPEESDEEEEDSEKTSKVSSSMTEVDKDQGLLKPKSKDDIDSIKKDKGKGGSSINSSATTIEVVTAHKIVLSQFEYFRTMFSSSFAEGGPGAKTIRIKDTDPQCFRILIEHLYLGQLTSNMEPRITTEDFVQENVPTWEDVYLVADRYNVTELRDRAAERILRNLSTAWVVPFLFRTAYLFEDLRLPVIKYIVQFCMSSVAAKDALAKYYEHEECSSIMADILKELWTAKTNTASK